MTLRLSSLTMLPAFTRSFWRKWVYKNLGVHSFQERIEENDVSGRSKGQSDLFFFGLLSQFQCPSGQTCLFSYSFFYSCFSSVFFLFTDTPSGPTGKGQSETWTHLNITTTKKNVRVVTSNSLYLITPKGGDLLTPQWLANSQWGPYETWMVAILFPFISLHSSHTFFSTHWCQ